MLDATTGVTPEKAIARPGGASARGSHRLAATHSCERLWAFRYHFGIVPVGHKTWTLTGTLVHTCLAYHYAERLVGPKPDWFSHPLDEALEEQAEGYPELIRTAKEIYRYYVQHWAAGDTWKPVYVEEEFSASIGELDPDGPYPELNNERITARTDLVIEANGELWIVDHKTTSGGWNSDRLPQWKDDGEYLLSWQAMLYLHVVRQRIKDRNVRGFVIQRIKRKAPFDIDRNALRMPALAYGAVPRTARMMIKRETEIQERIANGISPTPNFSACQGRYGACDYRDLCAAENHSLKAMAMHAQFKQIGGVTSGGGANGA